jgi:hypothetical protein
MLHQWDQRPHADPAHLRRRRKRSDRRLSKIGARNTDRASSPIRQFHHHKGGTTPRSFPQDREAIAKQRMLGVRHRDMRYEPVADCTIPRRSVIRPSQMPSSIASCTTPTASPSRARASAKPPPSVKTLTPRPPTDLMPTPTRDPAQPSGRHHRNARPASIGTGGRLRSEFTADFVGMRIG